MDIKITKISCSISARECIEKSAVRYKIDFVVVHQVLDRIWLDDKNSDKNSGELATLVSARSALSALFIKRLKQKYTLQNPDNDVHIYNKGNAFVFPKIYYISEKKYY